MTRKKLRFIDRLLEAYDLAKKPIAYIVVICALLLQTLPDDLLPHYARDVTYTAVLLALALIVLQVLFEIYDNVKEPKELNVITSNDLLESILDIVSKERKVSIKYIGIAGRHGWTSVLEKLLHESDPDSLIGNRTRFEIDVALLNPAVQSTNTSMYWRFETVASIANTVRAMGENLPDGAVSGSRVHLHLYDHMPNVLGFLINENYLFLTHAYWEQLQGRLTLRGGGTDYFVYDKNDDFGGQEMIRRFMGWYDFILDSHDNEPATLGESISVPT